MKNGRHIIENIGKLIERHIINMTVSEDGQSIDLNLAWEWFNEVLFAGEMVRPSIYGYTSFITISGDPRPLVGCYQFDNYYRPEILINVRQSKAQLLWTLLHEMCHQYVHEVLGDHRAHHGPVWEEVYNDRLYELSTLVEVLQNGVV